MAAVINEVRLPPLPTIRDIIRMYRLRAMKQLSQNFIMDEKLTNKIVKATGGVNDCYVCEVGPGPGTITRSILRKGAKELIVVEKDRRFLPTLDMLVDACNNRMKVVIGDVMSFNMEKVFPEECRREWDDQQPNIHIIGNLPFNVSTHLIIRWLHAISERRNAWSYGRVPLTLTFQKEVAERMVADIMTPQRCRLSVMCQYLCHVNHKFTIPGRAFVPKPDVDVGVVKFVPLREPIIDNVPFTTVEKVVRTIFNMRGKRAYKAASNLFPLKHREDLTHKLHDLSEVDLRMRPYQITNEEFSRLCHVYQDICKTMPSVADYNFRSENSEADMELLDSEVEFELQELVQSGVLKQGDQNNRVAM